MSDGGTAAVSWVFGGVDVNAGVLLRGDSRRAGGAVVHALVVGGVVG